ncbi:MAG: PhoH family protein [Candidatus Wallbacteria bacterium]|nr:PhoH family protein [Candidatus Wallbacteria bacterium]
MKKRFVLDTNVLIHNPEAVDLFEDNDIVIPMVVLEELDHLKKRPGSVGQNARRAIKRLESLRGNGDLHVGVPLKDGGTLSIELNYRMDKNLPDCMDRSKPDNQIISVARDHAARNPSIPVIIVSKDANVRVKSEALGLKAEDFESDKANVSELFKGFEIVEVSKKTIDAFYLNFELQLEDHEFFANQCVLLRTKTGSHSILTKFSIERQRLIPLYHITAKPWGVEPRNLEQRFAIELLLADDIKIVSLVGLAGTGKTLLALAAGLQKILEEKSYKRMLVARPIIPMGKDIGYLPGSKDEKLTSWMQPITDNLDLLFGADVRKEYNYLYENGLIQIEALTYIRGRSLPNSFIIIDEAQNLTPHEIKTIITRAGENSKIVLTGDPYQIDNQYLDESSNGLSYVAERFKYEKIAGHIVMNKGERSELASIAARIL